MFRTAKWRSFLAGAIAGPAILLTGLNTEHTSLAIYIFMRATVLATRCGIKSKRFGRICKPLTWAHGDIFLMCLSSSQILSAYLLKPDSLPPSYKAFLNKHGAKDSVILNAVRDIACGLPFKDLEAVETHYKSNGVDIKLDPEMKIPCSIIHGNQACGTHVLSFLLQAYKRALPVYLPVYLIPALIVHRQGLLRRYLLALFPLNSLKEGNYFIELALPHFMERTLWYREVKLVSLDVLFIRVVNNEFKDYNFAHIMIWTCFLFRLFKRCNIPMVAMGTFPTGLALAIEKKSRRIEISLYCLARAIESFFTCMADVGYMPRSKKLKRADVLIFSISTAVIMHCYAMERDVFRSKYLNVLDWVFGVPLPLHETTPRKKRVTNQ
ncbi:hypothetical protein BUALT_Bualt08G0027400 [Buddleja alternifolia]|uniref:Transmembrane protein 135 N-terminal domain-containing protein n=1 Tax=Buddleja alternifolia TaxID=168488 RepID=A0AAV6X355_9LAMI|nr:hypothetical protein BUALT_Bualt08G0027400 [Buddleja alternifolia]